jgi:RimJ/RimL family protein N-acetyltransferase
VIALETERLILRELEETDLDFVAAMLGHPEVMAWWPSPLGRAESMQWIERQRHRYARDGQGYWLALARQTGEPLGQAGVLTLDPGEGPEIALGWILHRPFWGRGYATEAAIACRDRAFTLHPRLAEVVAPIRPGNAASEAVARRIGMRPGRTAMHAGFEHVFHVISRVEWEAAHPALS